MSTPKPTPECTPFEERAAIMEFDGKLSREEAERCAREEHPKIMEAEPE